MLHVIQVSFHHDVLGREPERLLELWPTLTQVASAVAGTGVRVMVLQAARQSATIERDGVLYHFVAERYAPFLPLPGGMRVPRPPRRLLALASGLAPDLVHVQGLGFPIQIRYLARELPRVPILAQDHATRPPHGWRRAVYRHGLAALSGVAFTARAQAEAFVNAGVLRPELPVFEVMEGSTRFTPGDQRAARQATGLGGDPCLVWVGHLNTNKDPLTVLDAVSRAAAALPGIQLWCCFATAPLLEQVRKRIALDAALRGRVHLLGARSHKDVELLLQAADFLVLGSHVEGSGYAVIEALACGTTPVVTDIPSFRRIVGGGEAGALWRPGDAAAMARALVEWAHRDRGRLRKAARKHFERALSFDVIGAELRAAYSTLTGRS